MKTLLVVMLFVVCGTACVDERGAPGGRIRLVGAPELRFSGGFNARLNDAGPHTVHVTYRGRTIRYEQDTLYVDERQVVLPARARVVAFDGPNIYVDGRELETTRER